MDAPLASSIADSQSPQNTLDVDREKVGAGTGGHKRRPPNSIAKTETQDFARDTGAARRCGSVWGCFRDVGRDAEAGDLEMIRWREENGRGGGVGLQPMGDCSSDGSCEVTTPRVMITITPVVYYFLHRLDEADS